MVIQDQNTYGTSVEPLGLGVDERSLEQAKNEAPFSTRGNPWCNALPEQWTNIALWAHNNAWNMIPRLIETTHEGGRETMVRRAEATIQRLFGPV